MTPFSIAQYAMIGVLVLMACIAHATGLSPGTEDPDVARWITEDVIADDRSALTLDGHGVRFVGQPGGGGIVTPTPVPVPPMLPVFAIAIAALIWKGWK